MGNLNNSRLEGLPPIIENSSKVIVLGTFPGEQSLEVNEYYANPSGNQFWEIMSTLLTINSSESYPDKISYLLDKKIALWDVIGSCIRNESSLDKAIEEPVLNDLDHLLEKYTNIKAVGFNGATAFNDYASKAHSGFDCLTKLDNFVLISSSRSRRVSVKEKIRDWYNKLSRYVDFIQ